MTERQDESFYYPAIKEWLSKKGWNALISAEAGISIPTGPYFPKITIQPDIVGYKKENHYEKIVSVEVKTTAEKIYEGLGQCSIYQIMSPVSVNLKFEPEENYHLESTFHNQLLNMLRDFFAK